MIAAPGHAHVRSALFVPASRDDFLAKAHLRGADALILDLEDAVATGEKHTARARAAAWITDHERSAPAVFVRVNPGQLDDDLAAVVRPGLRGVVLPKVQGPEDVRRVADQLSYREGTAGLGYGSVRIWPLVETASAVRLAFEIAGASNRVVHMGGGTSEQGDLAHEVGFRWSAAGAESLFIRSKVLVDVRAAGIENPVSGLVSALLEDPVVRGFARQARDLGYEGMMVIHPRHVPVANEVFTASGDEVAAAVEVLDALAAAEASGQGAVAHQGRMVDLAMARSAAAVVAGAGAGAGADAGTGAGAEPAGEPGGEPGATGRQGRP